MGEYAMKKLLFILISTTLLIIALACEVIPLFMILWETRGSDVTSGGRGWIVAGVVLVTFLLLAVGTRPASRIRYQTKVITLGYDRADCDAVIMKYASVADSRKTCRNLGANIELVTPPGFDAAKLDYDARLNLEWLKRHGAKNGVTIKDGK